MKLWKDNRKDGEWELSEEEIAKRFLVSDWGKHWSQGAMFIRCLAGFITGRESEGGLNSVFERDEEALDRIAKRVLELSRTS